MEIISLYRINLINRLKAKTKYIGNCWVYEQDPDDYGRLFTLGKNYGVHRLSASIFHGLDIEDNESLACHKPECKYKNCWNPEHLYIGTHVINMQDKKVKPCKHCGGPRDVIGVSMGAEYRYCRPCRQARVIKGKRK